MSLRTRPVPIGVGADQDTAKLVYWRGRLVAKLTQWRDCVYVDAFGCGPLCVSAGLATHETEAVALHLIRESCQLKEAGLPDDYLYHYVFAPREQPVGRKRTAQQIAETVEAYEAYKSFQKMKARA